MKLKCERCGNCCKHQAPIAIREEEITIIAHFLKITFEEFVSKYTRQFPIGDDWKGAWKPDYSLKTPCLFHDNQYKKCMINEVKPWTCLAYPIGRIEEMLENSEFNFINLMETIKEGVLENEEVINCKALERLAQSPIGRLKSFENGVQDEVQEIQKKYLMFYKQYVDVLRRNSNDH